jgi:hypothetical protein
VEFKKYSVLAKEFVSISLCAALLQGNIGCKSRSYNAASASSEGENTNTPLLGVVFLKKGQEGKSEPRVCFMSTDSSRNLRLQDAASILNQPQEKGAPNLETETVAALQDRAFLTTENDNSFSVPLSSLQSSQPQFNLNDSIGKKAWKTTKLLASTAKGAAIWGTVGVVGGAFIGLAVAGQISKGGQIGIDSSGKTMIVQPIYEGSPSGVSMEGKLATAVPGTQFKWEGSGSTLLDFALLTTAVATLTGIYQGGKDGFKAEKERQDEAENESNKSLGLSETPDSKLFKKIELDVNSMRAKSCRNLKPSGNILLPKVTSRLLALEGVEVYDKGSGCELLDNSDQLPPDACD